MSFEVTPSTLYMVASPIGNMADISQRALKVLAEVDFIYAEDTRVTRKILDYYEIKGVLRSFRQSPNRVLMERTIKEFLWEMSNGKSVAYLTDAGTPGVSDPGGLLVSEARGAGFKVEPIPGASAMTSLISVAGVPVMRPLFVGFLPKKKGHQTLMNKLKAALIDGLTDFVIIYESPERIKKLLAEVVDWQVEGTGVIIGRELTKLHEEILAGTVEMVYNELKARERVRGEIVLGLYLAKKNKLEFEEENE